MKSSVLASFLGGFLFATVFLGCPPEPLPPRPPKPVAVADASISQACEKLRELGCPEGQPVESGETCEQLFENAAQGGINPHADCIAGLEACNQIRECVR